MPDYSIVTSPLSFSESVLGELAPTSVDDKFRAVLRVLLHSIWRGAFRTRASLVQDQVQPDLGYLCLSSYLALPPYLQMARLGNPADAIILLRAHMERTALVGYLDSHRDEIPKYASGKGNLQKSAMRWAKDEAPENWMKLYGVFSNIAHSRIVGPAAHILADNEIGAAFRQDLSPHPQKGAEFTEILLGGGMYALLALDSFTSKILGSDKYPTFLKDLDLFRYLDRSDLEEFRAFAESMVATYSRDGEEQSAS